MKGVFWESWTTHSTNFHSHTPTGSSLKASPVPERDLRAKRSRRFGEGNALEEPWTWTFNNRKFLWLREAQNSSWCSWWSFKIDPIISNQKWFNTSMSHQFLLGPSMSHLDPLFWILHHSVFARAVGVRSPGSLGALGCPRRLATSGHGYTRSGDVAWGAMDPCCLGWTLGK